MNIITNTNSAALDSSPYQERMWTPKRLAAVLAAVCVLVICWQVADVRLGTLFQRTTFDALRTLLSGLFPPDLSIQFLRTVFHAIVTTLATAIIGTVLSVLIAIPLGALGTTSLQRGGILGAAENGNLITILRSWVGRAVIALLGFLRAIPDLVWGLLFVTAVGLGSLAGTLALTVSYVGVLGRVYAHAFADVDSRPLEALQATGATRTQIFLRGIWPQALPNVTAYTLYSFECCVRAASVLGFVGAGGIGYEISLSMRLFEYGQVMTLILAFILLLALTDYASRWLRVRLQPDAGSVQTHRQFDGLSNGRYNSLVRPALGYLVLTVVMVASFYLAGFSPEHFGEANIIGNIFRFCRGMFPPDFTKQFVLSLSPLLLQTMAISILGTLLGMVIGGILAIPATSPLVTVRADAPGAESHIERVIRSGVFWTARLLLNLLRSIPDLVWVLICIIVVGIGPFAGTLAIGLHTGGVLGKLYAETLEEVSPQPVEALRALGAGPVQLFLWALWPQARRMLASYTVLRWETNLRVSAILGLVGGGGIGQAIYNNVQLGFYPHLATLLIVIYALVIACDWIADKASRTTVGV
ncbi:MAG TPA: ABC transporter permease subunit [Candidatus Acidoferrum sp.]|jgi:phosphonate transport system permease protein